MPDTPQTFDDALTAWRQWQESPSGRLRFTLAEANLDRHLGEGALRVLDLAGADGGDAVWLAARGHHVTIVDFAPGMLAAATDRAKAAGLADRIDCVHADVLDLPVDIGGYDVVLCHNLLQFQADSAPILAAALAPLRAGGLLSVMAINRHATPLITAIRENDLAAALSALDDKEGQTHTFDTTITLHSADEIIEGLGKLGCELLGHYGIRSVCDYIADDERKHDPEFFADLERLELALTNRAPYMHTARIFQVTALK